MAIFSASIAVAGYVLKGKQIETKLTISAFGGLIATGVSFLSGKAGLYGWQWL
jgi:hypothetical protein